MLSTLPDILNGYRDSLTRHNMPGSFTYFALDKYPSNSKLEGPKYNIWNSPILYPDQFNSFATDVNLKHSSNNLSRDFPLRDSTDYSTPTSTDSYNSGPDSSRNSTSNSPMEESSSPLSKSLSSPISSNEYDDSSPPSSNDDPSDSSYDSGSDGLLPSMELIVPYKRLDLAPSCFLNGCVCGHHFEFRDMAYESRKHRNPRSNGVTIRPKTQPISAKLRCCAG